MQPRTTRRPGKLILGTLAGIIVAAMLGGVVALLSATHSWGIVSIFVLLALAYFIVQATKLVLRAAHVNRFASALRIAMLMMLVYLLTETWIAAAFMHTDLIGFYVSRWTTGLPLFGQGSWAISAWLWVVPYAIKLFFLYILFMGAAADEGDRPFCPYCKSATSNLIWKQLVGRFNVQRLEDFAKLEGQWNFNEFLTTLHRDQSGDLAVYIRVWTCDCNTRFEFRAESSKIDASVPAGDELIGYFPMSASTLCEIVSWVWRVDPEAQIPGPIFKLYEEHAPHSKPDEAWAE